ncbi:MAG: SH3 domain-containing protein [Anaerolineales bacterium]
MKPPIYLILTVSLVLASCTAPGSDAPPADVATAAAMTVQAALESNQSSLASPTSAQSTPESKENPMASFEDVTNCRVGPGVNFERVTQIQPGVAVEIIGSYPPNYWIVQSDKGPCWVAGEFVTPSGSVSVVPTVTAPPTPTGGAPENVSLQKWDVACDYATNEAKVSIAWKDKEDETSYQVIRNDVIIAELPANTTAFEETITLISGQTARYSIIAITATGSTQSQTISLGC